METFDTSKPPWLLARDIHMANQKREDERQSNFQQKRIDNVMNTPKNYDQIQDLKKSDFFSTVKQVLNSSDEVRHATKNLNTNLYKSRNRHIDNKNKRQF